MSAERYDNRSSFPATLEFDSLPELGAKTDDRMLVRVVWSIALLSAIGTVSLIGWGALKLAAWLFA